MDPAGWPPPYHLLLTPQRMKQRKRFNRLVTADGDTEHNRADTEAEGKSLCHEPSEPALWLRMEGSSYKQSPQSSGWRNSWLVSFADEKRLFVTNKQAGEIYR